MTSSPEDVNSAAWDLRTGVHVGSDFYGTDRVVAGESSLCPPEVRLVGDVTGQRLLHLQCHFGLDTISWSRAGAVATGVDFSPAAVTTARRLATEAGLDVTYVCSDVQRLPPWDEPFDVVVTTYGVMCWLADLDAWARGVHDSLRPGGRFVLVEHHPTLELHARGSISGSGTYFRQDDPEAAWTEGTYTDREAPISYQEYRWQFSVADVVTALLTAGLEITGLEEMPYCSHALFPELDSFEGGVWRRSSAPAERPYMFSLTARRRSA